MRLGTRGSLVRRGVVAIMLAACCGAPAFAQSAVWDLMFSKPKPKPMQAAGRGAGEKIVVPLLAEVHAGRLLLLPGKRALKLSWAPTLAPPYKVSVEIDKKAVAEMTTTGTSVTLPDADLKFGFLTIRILDSDPTPTDAILECAVVAVPPSGAAAASDTAAPGFQRTLAAFGLLTQDEGAWRLEAYQQLRALAPTYAPARELAERLDLGQRIEE